MRFNSPIVSCKLTATETVLPVGDLMLREIFRGGCWDGEGMVAFADSTVTTVDVVVVVVSVLVSTSTHFGLPF